VAARAVARLALVPPGELDERRRIAAQHDDQDAEQRDKNAGELRRHGALAVDGEGGPHLGGADAAL